MKNSIPCTLIVPKTFVRFIWILFVIVFSCGDKEVDATQKRKVVLVILDGIPASTLEQTDTPNLDEISQIGDYRRAWLGGEKGGYSETPTISAVGYNSMLTGTWANKHNVKDNRIQFPNYNYWTIFRHFKQTYPDMTTAVYSTWLDNRTKLLGDGLEETGYLKIDYHFDGLELDTIRFPHDTLSFYIHEIDKLVAENAAKEILEKSPDLTWVYLQYTDDMGHKFGEGLEMNAAVQEADKQIGLIWKSIKERKEKNGEEFLLIVTTDHGRALGGFHHGGQTSEEREIWIVSNQQFLWPKDLKPAIVDIFPTVADFFQIQISKEQAMELDGVSLIEKPYAYGLKGVLDSKQLHLSWEFLGENGEGRVWITLGNQFRFGKQDEYTFLGKVNLNEEKAIFDLSELDFQNAKVIMEMPKGYLNYWVLKDGK
jgi:hypothetical protein